MEEPSRIQILKRKLDDLDDSKQSLQTQLDEVATEIIENSKELDSLLTIHDFVPIEVGPLVWVAATKGRKAAHHAYDWRFDPRGMGQDSLEFAPCLKSRNFAPGTIKWMSLFQAVKQPRLGMCGQCTPEWVLDNWDFALHCGTFSSWIRWTRCGVADHLYHTDNCITLHDPALPFSVMRVNEEEAVNLGNAWKPCLLCHTRRLPATATASSSPSY